MYGMRCTSFENWNENDHIRIMEIVKIDSGETE